MRLRDLLRMNAKLADAKNNSADHGEAESSQPQPEIIIEPTFDIIDDDRIGLILVIFAKPGTPKDPVIQIEIDGDEALFWRSEDMAIRLTRFHPDALAAFKEAKQVIVIEAKQDDSPLTYTVPIKIEGVEPTEA